jgi:hypothetical protein
MANIEALTLERQDEKLRTLRDTTKLSGLISHAEEIQKECVDYYVNSRHTWVEDDIKLGFNCDGYEAEKEMSQYSFSQLCTKFGVPVKYMKKCLVKGELDLVSDNLNRWLEKENEKKLMIRTYNDRVRGILSDKYSKMDSPEILTALDSATSGNFSLKSYVMNEERLHVRMIGDKLNVPNEDLFTGIQIDSSDVGRNLLNVQFFVYKQVCTNGLVVPVGGSTLYSQKHIGIKPDDFNKELKRNLDIIPEVAAQVGDIIVANGGMNQLTHYDKLVEKVVGDLKLPKETTDKIIELTPKYGRNNKWSLVNTLTEIAQDYSLERRLEIEKYAGKLLVA